MTDLTDASIQVRISRKTLATLAMWFVEHGDTPSSLSKLAMFSMEVLKDYIVEKGFVPAFTSTLEATKALESIGLGNLTIKGRKPNHGKSKYLEQMQIDEGVAEISPLNTKPFKMMRSKQEAKVESFDAELSDAVKAITDRDEEIKKALKSVPEDTIVEEREEKL